MFTSSLKFYENTSFDEMIKTKDIEYREKCAKILESKDWVMEHEVKISCNVQSPDGGGFYMKEILEKNDIKYADILYDFKGNVSIEYDNFFGDISIKIEENTFTRDVPYYHVANFYHTFKFKIQGEVTFKIGILNHDTRITVGTTRFNLPFTNDYFISYYGGCATLFPYLKALKNLIILQKFCRKNFRYFLFKRWIKTQEFASWFYAPENFGGYKTKLRLQNYLYNQV